MRAGGTACLVALLAAGCNTPGPTQQRLLLFPSPPDKPRIQFLTWASSAEEVEGPISLVSKLALGGEPTNRPALDKPYGLAARDGVVYVCDTKIPGLARLDFKNKTFTLIGIDGPGRLRKPINLTIDPLGYKFVADPMRYQVVVFGPDDAYVTAFDIPRPSHPVDVALWENELYVLDNDPTCQIFVLDRKSGEVLRTIAGPGMEPGQFKTPNSLSFGPDGNLYVSDTLNFRIQKITRDGEPIWSQGVAGRRLGEFSRPRGLSVAPDGVVYVADAGTEIIQMYNEEGKVLMHFGGPGTVPGACVLPASVAADATSIPYFKEYLHPSFAAEYLLFVSNQFGRHLISVYAFGSFPEGYAPSQSQIQSLPAPEPGSSGPRARERQPAPNTAPDRKEDQPESQQED